MWLWEKPRADIAYCLVNTPEELIGWENKTFHKVDHINRELRVTVVPYVRDTVMEDKIKTKVEAARVYYDQVLKEISEQHIY
jgi:predicted 2-oxoglutarate/Fe(II)-dependent dioxygenase YbiX